MFNKLFILIFFLVLLNETKIYADEKVILNTHTSERILLFGKLNDLSSSIQKIAETSTSREQIRSKMETLMNSITDTTQLEFLTIRNKADSHIGEAEDTMSIVLDEAFLCAIRRIKEIGGETAINSLKNIILRSNPDGGHSLVLKETLEKLQKSQKKSTWDRILGTQYLTNLIS